MIAQIASPHGVFGARRTYADVHVDSPASQGESATATTPKAADPLLNELVMRLSQRPKAKAVQYDDRGNARRGSSEEAGAADGAVSVDDIATDLFSARGRTSGASDASAGSNPSTEGAFSVNSVASAAMAASIPTTPREARGFGRKYPATTRPVRSTGFMSAVSAALAAKDADVATALAAGSAQDDAKWRLSLFGRMAATPGRESIKRLFPTRE